MAYEKGVVRRTDDGRWVARYKESGSKKERFFDEQHEAVNFVRSLPDPPPNKLERAGEAMQRTGTSMTKWITVPIVMVFTVYLIVRAVFS